MARRELGPAAWQVARAVRTALESVASVVLPGRASLPGRPLPDHPLPDNGLPGRPVVLGVSGGADSMALAAGAAWVLRAAQRAGDHGPDLRAVIVDHGLQSGSDEVAALVAGRVEGLGLATEVVRVEVRDRGQGPEAAAREARLAALARVADGGVVLLGHTLDDQAETVLQGLARGSGTRSLAGMRAETAGGVRILRPLLGLRREVTRAACAEWGLEVWEDPHNDQDRFTRVRVRHHVLPVLERELGPGIAEALARTADLARADADALDEWARRAGAAARSVFADGESADSEARSAHSHSADGESANLEGPSRGPLQEPMGQGLDCTTLAELPVAVSSRVVRNWLLDLGAPEVQATHVAAVLELATRWRGQGPINVPGLVIERRGHVVRRAPRH
ncbi:tRNA lysidine(34) synthetase TilS [Propionibacteriaceae bacterium Y1923]|uniref:tRNA lysidine(34) synthetase TilS n=1 Tax=Aestuariimicrobium sp. Y1814 TaxID=3418742 RepID=UPI003C2142AC